MNTKIKHPWTAFIIIFLMSAFFSELGLINGTLIILNIVLGVIIYKLISIYKH